MRSARPMGLKKLSYHVRIIFTFLLKIYIIFRALSLLMHIQYIGQRIY